MAIPVFYDRHDNPVYVGDMVGKYDETDENAYKLIKVDIDGDCLHIHRILDTSGDWENWVIDPQATPIQVKSYHIMAI